jgi:hypothetical protein
MNITYYFEDASSVQWNDRHWLWLRLGARARERYWFAGFKYNEADTVRIYYFTLPVGVIADVPPTNSAPTPIPIQVDLNQSKI